MRSPLLNLPSFGCSASLQTHVVRVGSEFAALVTATGEVIGARTHRRMEDAAHHARVAAAPKDDAQDDHDRTCAGCVDCVGF